MVVRDGYCIVAVQLFAARQDPIEQSMAGFASAVGAYLRQLFVTTPGAEIRVSHEC